ncbi:hypothetical protein [Desulforhabdus amnigena]|uniref:hypothetical protein n=1 Tax=Desulforhabdus amnigena TaxID=40218 RepID=UPI002491D415|nr:hypothetical protein [Desulforhabdus amnigena]
MSPQERIWEAARSLGEEEAQVLELLYGFGGRSCSTPEEVSRALGCPPEAVLKMETGAIRRLRHPRVLRSIVQALDDAVEEIWRALAGPNRLLFKSELQPTIEEHLPGELRVAVKVRYEAIQPWLEEHTCETPGAWYRGRYSCDELLHAIARIETIHSEICLPTPLSFLSQLLEMDLELLIPAIKLADSSSIYRGYLSNSSMGERVSRAVDIHLLFASKYIHECVTLGRLTKEYNLLHPNDALGPDEVETVLNTSSHLFRDAGWMGWCATGLPKEDLSYINSGPPSTPLDPDGRISRHQAKRSDELSKTDPLDLIRQILEEGPCHVSELDRRFEEKSSSAFGPKMLTGYLKASEDFIILAPEIFALKDHLSDPAILQGALPFLFTPRHCRLYTLFRHAGEPMDAYPLWPLMGEQRLCGWAESHVERKLFSSLLAIAEPQKWEAPRAFRDIWSFKKQCIGRHYHIALNVKKSAWKLRPALHDLFAIALCTQQWGYINWLRIEQILRPQLLHQIHDQTAVPLLALMIASNIVGPADHWQKMHRLNPEAEPLLTMMSHELQKKGNILWEDDAGRRLMERLKSGCGTTDLGWVDPAQMGNLLRSLRKK